MAICEGDQNRRRPCSTYRRRRGFPPSLVLPFLRSDDLYLESEAAAWARYPRLKSRWLLTSRMTVLGERASDAAIFLNESPQANPRLISSRSSIDRRRYLVPIWVQHTVALDVWGCLCKSRPGDRWDGFSSYSYFRLSAK